MSEQIKIGFTSIPPQDDKIAFDNFFKHFYPRLTAYACLFLESEAAEDIVQDLFVYIWENSKFISIHTSLEAYLFKSVYQRCLNQIKQRKTRNIHLKIIENYLLEFESQLFDPDTNDSIRKLYMEELKEDINNAIDSLPEKCRKVFMLSYIHNLKNKEISKVLDISQSTVENHIYNALKILRQKLAKHSHIIAILFPL
ncbi:MAG: RNA polymerase sigma-70 factor [Bacteroidetes bacterium]|nr:RNA polymerase sigma-70 factor [Bacteroidota bacterium]